LLGVLKDRLKKTEFGNVDEVGDFFCHFWRDATFDEVQLLFFEWLCQHDGESVPG
jgi:hypothetical protein